MIAGPATSVERWKWVLETGVTESLRTNRGNDTLLPSLHLLWYDMMWLALLILFNYLLYYIYLYFIYILFIFYLYFIYISFIFHLYFIYISFIFYSYFIHIFIYLYIYHPLCAYTIYLDLDLQFPMRWWITSSRVSEIMTFLLLMRNTSRKPRAYTEKCLAIVFSTSTFLQVSQYCSFLNSHLYQKSQVVPWTFRHFNQSERHTIHQVLLNMIRVKEKRGLFGILNYAASIFPQCLFYFILQCFLWHKIDTLGTSQVVNIIKELWTVLDEPSAKRRTLDNTSSECWRPSKL